MPIRALICGLNGCGAASAGFASSGAACWATPRVASVTMPAKAKSPASNAKCTKRVCMVSSSSSFVPPQFHPARPRALLGRLEHPAFLHAHEANNRAHQHQHDKPVAAINPYQADVAHGEAVGHEKRGDDETQPAECARHHAIEQR